MNTINAARTETFTRESSVENHEPPCVAAPCPVADVLERAADYMERHGKCEGRLLDINGRVCVLGALGAVNGIYGDASLAFYKYMGSGVIQWSDTNDQATVVSTMRACAALERMKA